MSIYECLDPKPKNLRVADPRGFDPKISEKLAADFADKWVEVRPEAVLENLVFIWIQNLWNNGSWLVYLTF